LAPRRPLCSFLEPAEQFRAVKRHEREAAAEADQLVTLERGT
jgi:hypothetical protein